MQGGSWLLSMTYSRDKAGRIWLIDPPDLSSKRYYQYDDPDQLTRAYDYDTDSDRYFAYDAAHNLITYTPLGNYSYAAANAISVPPHAPWQAGLVFTLTLPPTQQIVSIPFEAAVGSEILPLSDALNS